MTSFAFETEPKHTIDWSGDFGREYTVRNRVAWQNRIPFWETIMMETNALSVLEVGCNAGWNLRAINAVVPDASLTGIDVNRDALMEILHSPALLRVQSAVDLDDENEFALVATVGCLIHVPPSDIDAVMSNIVRASARYVLAVEYAAETETMVPYRGHNDALWKRPFGKLYEAKGLKIVQQGFVSKDDGFDDCAFWLLSK